MKEEIELDIGFSYFGDPDVVEEYKGGESFNVQPGKGKRVIGIDLETIPGTRQDWDEIPIDQITGSADYLPLKNESVNSIFAGGVYGAYVDLEDSVREADRVLKPGGKIFIRTWGRYMPRLKLLLRSKYRIAEMYTPDSKVDFPDDDPLDYEWHVRAIKNRRGSNEGKRNY